MVVSSALLKGVFRTLVPIVYGSFGGHALRIYNVERGGFACFQFDGWRVGCAVACFVKYDDFLLFRRALLC